MLNPILRALQFSPIKARLSKTIWSRFKKTPTTYTSEQTVAESASNQDIALEYEKGPDHNNDQGHNVANTTTSNFDMASFISDQDLEDAFFHEVQSRYCQHRVGSYFVKSQEGIHAAIETMANVFGEDDDDESVIEESVATESENPRDTPRNIPQPAPVVTATVHARGGSGTPLPKAPTIKSVLSKLKATFANCHFKTTLKDLLKPKPKSKVSRDADILPSIPKSRSHKLKKVLRKVLLVGKRASVTTVPRLAWMVIQAAQREETR
ncbi:hypothetical protein HDV05_000583 [Chytridiales sp. JEL 0842]|nr:hypothetical protein HDV05_000583 [Chytridiales sp. JEL 0842]